MKEYKLGREVRIAETYEADQLQYTADCPVEEGEDHRRMFTVPDASRQSAAHG
jgi:hypothetical protein